MDIWGYAKRLFEIARRVGTVGYYCLVPDFYYREGTVRHEFRDEQNRMISLHALDEERRPTCDRARSAAVQSDGRSTIAGAILEVRSPARRARASGRHRRNRLLAWADGTSCAWRDATGDRHRVGESAWHQPHQRRSRLAASSGRAIARRALLWLRGNRSLRAPVDGEGSQRGSCVVPGHVSPAIHMGARHGYALPDRDIFHPRGAARDWEIVFAIFPSPDSGLQGVRPGHSAVLRDDPRDNRPGSSCRSSRAVIPNAPSWRRSRRPSKAARHTPARRTTRSTASRSWRTIVKSARSGQREPIG